MDDEIRQSVRSLCVRFLTSTETRLHRTRTILIPQMTVVFPILTRAEPSAVEMDPVREREREVSVSVFTVNNRYMLVKVSAIIVFLTYVQCCGSEFHQFPSIRPAVFFLNETHKRP